VERCVTRRYLLGTQMVLQSRRKCEGGWHEVENPRQFERCTRRRVACTDAQDADPLASPAHEV